MSTVNAHYNTRDQLLRACTNGVYQAVDQASLGFPRTLPAAGKLEDYCSVDKRMPGIWV